MNRLNFGNGEYGIHDGILDNKPCFVISGKGTGIVGDEFKVKEGFINNDEELFLATFENEKSVDVWIKHLKNIKESFSNS